MLSYIRTADGFVTAIHDVVAASEGCHRVATFNPGSNRNQASLLRLTNATEQSATVTIAGIDDEGASPGGPVSLTLDAGVARQVTAQQLETGDGVEGALGDGSGKWRLVVNSDQPIVVASLLESPTGHLTNLSTVPDIKTLGDGGLTTHHVPLFLSAADPQARQGFVRVINRSSTDASVRIRAYDKTGWNYDTVTLTVGGSKAAHFNSQDLELGNADKGLSGGIGAGQGDWRLEFTSEADIDVLGYIRTKDGFLTSMHDIAPLTEDGYALPIFNPASNPNQVSHLRIVNPGQDDADVTIKGVDDLGVVSGGDVELTVSAGQSRTVSAQRLEAGGETIERSLGDGTGKWRLSVSSDQPIQVMSLLESPTGHITNLSTAPDRRAE